MVDIKGVPDGAFLLARGVTERMPIYLALLIFVRVKVLNDHVHEREPKNANT